MAKFMTTVEVEGLDVQQAFDYLSDFSSTQEWDPGVSAACREDSGPLRVGSRFHVEAGFLGRTIPMVYEITEYRSPHSVVLRAENDSVISLDTLTFREIESGCSVTYDAVLIGKGIMGRFDFALQWVFNRIGRAAEAGLRKHLTQLAEQSRAGNGHG